MPSRHVVWLLVAALIAAASAYGVPRALDRGVLKTSLKISSLPRSVSNVSCKSASSTDVLTDCDFNFEPHDLSSLLSGRTYSHETNPDSLRHMQSGYEGNAPFAVAHAYRATNAASQEFKHGGHFLVFVNAARNRARTSLYIE